MAEPIVLSDEEEEEDRFRFSTPLPCLSKKRRVEPLANRTVLVIDDDPTPQRSMPSVVPETPFSVLGSSEIAMVKCVRRGRVGAEARASSPERRLSGISKFICLESDNESEGAPHKEILEDNETMGSDYDVDRESNWRSGYIGSAGFLGDDNLKSMHDDNAGLASTSEYGIPQEHDYSDRGNLSTEHTNDAVNQKTTKFDAEKNEHERFYKEALETEATQLREQHKEKQLKENGHSSLICLESDGESGSDSEWENWKENQTGDTGFDALQNTEWRSGFAESTDLLGDANLTYLPGGSYSHQTSSSEDAIHQVHRYSDKENISTGQIRNVLKQTGAELKAGRKNKVDGATRRNKIPEEDRVRVMEEKKQKKEQEKLQKAALKAEAAELRKQQKERKKWENGKLALKSIVAEIDSKVLELQSIGGPLLSRFAEKGITYRISSNPIKRSIVWTMNVPDHISQMPSNGIEIPYVLLIYEAEEICNLVTNGTFLDHVSGIRSHYPSHTVCYLTNRLMAYINKREKEQYKNPANSSRWKPPPVEEVMAKLTTHFIRVHSRHCLDEAEIAEHVVGLTSSLASCQFRKKSTRLSLNANGAIVPKDSVDKKIINRSPWLKALVAIPKVQPRFAMAIGKRYPTMKSLLRVYMDPRKSVHEKEFLLKDLITEGLVGGDRRLGEVCSKRVYRILMAQCGTIKTDDVENGADFFKQPSLTTPRCDP